MYFRNSWGNNEDREGVIDPKYAKFRCSKAKVLDIIYFNTSYASKLVYDETLVMTENYKPQFPENTGTSIYCKYKVHYKVGEIVYPKEYDSNPENVCAGGIHYFKSIMAAYWYSLNYNKLIGGVMPYEYYDNNGRLVLKGHYLNGKKVGQWKKWLEKSQEYYEQTYNIDGSLKRSIFLDYH